MEKAEKITEALATGDTQTVLAVILVLSWIGFVYVLNKLLKRLDGVRKDLNKAKDQNTNLAIEIAVALEKIKTRKTGRVKKKEDSQ